MQSRPRKCGICRQPAAYGNAVNAWCSHEHGAELAAKLKARADKRNAAKERRDQFEARQRIKTGPTLRKEAQAAFNAWIRERDIGQPCISCQRPDDGTWQRQAGHYRPAGSNPTLRFEPDNCHVQCARPCNMDKSGNLTEYRRHLINKIGLPRVEWLEGPHEPKHLSRQDLIDLKTEYQKAANELRKQRDVVASDGETDGSPI